VAPGSVDVGGHRLGYEGSRGRPLCASCVGSRIESNIDVGRDIDMMNGDEAYDGDHVEKYL
jgi:hypothetical protein